MKTFFIADTHFGDNRILKYENRAGFAEVYDALYVNTNMPYADIFGHVHASPVVKDYSAQHYCVSAERVDYTPIDFELIKRRIKEASDRSGGK